MIATPRATAPLSAIRDYYFAGIRRRTADRIEQAHGLNGEPGERLAHLRTVVQRKREAALDTGQYLRPLQEPIAGQPSFNATDGGHGRNRKMTYSAIHSPNLWKGFAAGIAAGLLASYAMDRFQAAVTALSDPADGDEEPATEKAADRVARGVTGYAVPEADKPLAGQAVHYMLGAALGASYGVVAEVRPEVTAGTGSLFGLSVAAVLDEAAVPAVGLGDAPRNTPLSTHLYTGASHVVFGVTAELTRRLMRNALT